MQARYRRTGPESMEESGKNAMGSQHLHSLLKKPIVIEYLFLISAGFMNTNILRFTLFMLLSNTILVAADAPPTGAPQATKKAKLKKQAKISGDIPALLI